MFTPSGRRKDPRSLVFVSALFLLFLAQCSIMYAGRNYNREKIDDIVIGKTTRQQVENLLGKPHAVAKKVQENIIIYTYKSLRTQGVAFPFLLSVGKTTESGNQVSIAFEGATGKVMNIEILEIGKD